MTKEIIKEITTVQKTRDIMSKQVSSLAKRVSAEITENNGNKHQRKKTSA